ncbi:Pheromone B alpha 1 receptor [Mycena venus]|uniref:Pheromone B alpha 1 receptor n=1 Tax=Mycena venus TaxID=2733690 RepID=A0A8H7CRL0_9AGAR|nr:Pheromone B alpha 1 receptor [Mycena venus]
MYFYNGAPNWVFSIFAFIGLVLSLIPLWWHLVARNTATCMYMIWTALACIVFFVDSIVWNGNMINWSPTWCDISTHFLYGFNVAIPACSLCINRRLYQIASVRSVTRTKRQRRRAIIIDLAIGLGIPILQIPLQYIVQGHRYNIFEDIGCLGVTYETPVAVALFHLPPILIGCVSAVYSVLSIHSFYHSRAQFKMFLSSNSNLNLYVRLMCIASTSLLLTIPMGIWVLWVNVKDTGLSPWISWDDTHSNFSRVATIPGASWRADPYTVASLETTRWATVAGAFLFFGHFGLADEAINNYRGAFFTVRTMVNNLVALFHMDRERSSNTAYEPPDDSPFRQYCTDNARIWKFYMDYAKTYDKTLSDLFNGDLDPLLLFAALFSAILAAFLIEIRKGLQEDLQSETNSLLIILIKNQHSSTGTEIPSFDNFVPAPSTRWMNGLWFLSLIFSLMSVFGASLAKGWVTQFASVVSASGWRDASAHCRRLGGLQRGRLNLFIKCLPLLIHIAFFLFNAGLVILLFHDDQPIGYAIFALTGVIALLYIANSILSAYYPDSPFRTPISDLIRRLFIGSWQQNMFSAFPTDEHARKAQALSWLLTHSFDAGIINEAIRAVAGLPCTLSVQDELIRGSTVSIISTLLSAEVSKNPSDMDLLSAYLYAMLRLIQAAPPDTESVKVIRTLVETGGALVNTDLLPPSLREVSLQFLFNTEISVLANTGVDLDPHLHRLLVEVCLLANSSPESNSLPPFSPSYTFLDVLKDASSVNRNQVHVELARTASRGQYFKEDIVHHSASTWVRSLAMGSSKDQKRCMEMVHEVASSDDVCSSIFMEETIQNIASMLADPNGDVRDSTLQTISTLAQNDNGRVAILKNETVEKIVSMLEDSSRSVRRRTLQTIASLVQYDDGRVAILTYETIKRIAAMLRDPNEDVRNSTMQTIATLAQYENSRVAILKHETIKKIVSMMGDLCLNVRESALQTIASLVQCDDGRAAILTHETIKTIVWMLRDLLRSAPQSALRTIAALAQYADNSRAATLMHETIQTIISMLGDSSGDVRRSARETIAALMQYDDGRAAILTHGTILKLSPMLEDVSWEVRQNALQTIAALGRHDGGRAAILTHETIQTIVSTLWDSSGDVRQSARETIAALMEYDDGRAAIFTHETIQTLLSMLEHLFWEVRQSTLQTIAAVGRYDGCQAAILTHRTIQKIVLMLGDSSWNVRRSARETIAALMEYDTGRAAILTYETIQTITSMLGDSSRDTMAEQQFLHMRQFKKSSKCWGDLSWEVRQNALQTIAAFMQYDDGRAAILTHETIQKVVPMLGDVSREVRQNVLQTIATLMQYEDGRAAISIHETIQKVVPMLGDVSWEVRHNALQTTAGLIQYDGGRTAILTHETIQTIVSTLWDSSGDIRQSARETIAALMEYDDGRAAIVTHETIQKVIPMLGNSSGDVRQSARETIAAFMEYDDGRAAILTHVTIQKIVPMLRDSSGDVRQSAWNTIAALMKYDTGRAAILTHETIQTIASMLGDSSKDVRQSARETITAFMQYDDGRTVILAHETIQKIVPMLGDVSWQVRQNTLQTIAALGRYG